jgi:hypothetical protein
MSKYNAAGIRGKAQSEMTCLGFGQHELMVAGKIRLADSYLPRLRVERVICVMSLG